MYFQKDIIKKANNLIELCGTRNPYEIAEKLNIIIVPQFFNKQRGAYKIIKRNSFIFINTELDSVMEKIVLYHEIGHYVLHKSIAAAEGQFQEFNIFGTSSSRTEYEANLFAAELAIPNDEILEYISYGYTTEQIAQVMETDINLIALKIDILKEQGYNLYKQDYTSDFLL